MLPKSCDRTAAYLDMRKAYRSRLRDVNVSELSLYGTGAEDEITETPAEVRKSKPDLSAEHAAYMAQMPEEKRDSFVGMSADDRDAFMAKNPLKKSKLAKKLKKLRKAIKRVAPHVAQIAKEAAERREASTDKAVAGHVIGQALAALTENIITAQASISKRAGESDLAAYNRALTEQPQLYAALERAKQIAGPDPFVCKSRHEPSAELRGIEKRIVAAGKAARCDDESLEKAIDRALTGEAYAAYEAARTGRPA